MEVTTDKYKLALSQVRLTEVHTNNWIHEATIAEEHEIVAGLKQDMEYLQTLIVSLSVMIKTREKSEQLILKKEKLKAIMDDMSQMGAIQEEFKTERELNAVKAQIELLKELLA